MSFNSPLFFEFQQACACFQQMVDLTVPDDCRTELVLLSQTPPLIEVFVWQHERRLFPLSLSADHTHRVIEHWHQFLQWSSLEQERLGRPLTAQERRPLARSTLLALLRAMDASA